MKRVISVLISVFIVFSMFSFVSAAEKNNFNLIEYLEENEVASKSELFQIIEMNTSSSIMTVNSQSLTYVNDLNEEEVSFRYSINYENQTVEVDTVYNVAATSYTTSGRATHDVLSAFGNIIYTVTTTGTFTRNSQTCVTSSSSGSFSPSSTSTWSSTPSFSRGTLSRTQAYARTYGTARSGVLTKNYNLTLICDTSGTLTSTFVE